MPVYIESAEVSHLIEAYAKRQGKNKMDALLDLLRRELGIAPAKSSKARYRDILNFVQNSPTERSPIPHSAFDSLDDYLEAHRPPGAASKRV